MSEYYIKQPNTDHTRGPLSLEQLISMGETGSVTMETLLYDDVSEKWKPIASYTDMIPVLFPEKPVLKLNRKETHPTEEQVANAIAQGRKRPKVSTETILAEASGDTRSTRRAGARRRSREKAAELAIPGIGALLLILGISLLFPIVTTIISSEVETLQWQNWVLNPLVILGASKLLLAFFVFLGMTEVFSYVRVVAGLLAGVSAYLFWSWGNPLLAGIGFCMGTGLFWATFSVYYARKLLLLSTSLLGAIVYGYCAYIGVLVY